MPAVYALFISYQLLLYVKRQNGVSQVCKVSLITFRASLYEMSLLLSTGFAPPSDALQVAGHGVGTMNLPQQSTGENQSAVVLSQPLQQGM